MLSFELVERALERVKQVQNGTLAAYRRLFASNPDFFVIHEGYSDML